MSSDDSPLVDAVEGATKGVLSWSEEKIKDLVAGFNDRRYVFVKNKETIDLIREQLKSGDWSLCKQYLKDSRLKILVQMGLALRKLESKPEQLLDLREKISKKYQYSGLHIAQVVQNGILTEFIGAIASRVNSEAELVEAVESVLLNVDKWVLFIKSTDSVDRRVNEINIKLQANNPQSMILFSCNSAVETCRKIKESIEKELLDYSVQSKDDSKKYLVFMFKKSVDLFS